MDAGEFVRDKATGKLSATRLLLLFWGFAVLITWVVVSITSRTLAAIPESVVTILGIVFGAKAVQRFGER